MKKANNFQIAKVLPQGVCCLAFAYFFANFSFALLVLLIKKACICTNDYALCAPGFCKSMGAQTLVYRNLRHYCPHPYKSEWPMLDFKSSGKTPFSIERLNKYFEDSHKLSKHFLITL